MTTTPSAVYTAAANSELEQAIIRLLLGSLVVGYIRICLALEDWVVVAYLIFLFCSSVLALHVYFRRELLPGRIIIGQLIDMTALSSIFFYGGEAAAPAYGVYLWIILGNGCRYGIPALLSAIFFAEIGFCTATFFHPFWMQHTIIAAGLALALLIVPFYFGVLLNRLNKATAMLQNLSLHDELTGLKNRRAFDQSIEHEFAWLQRKPDHFALAIIDIDHFKKVNDQFGHLVGDSVLQEVARILQVNCRSIDTVARFGGEEFAVLLPALPRAEADAFGERLRQSLETAVLPARPSPQQSINITVSIGLACWQSGYRTIEEWLLAADNALYVAKSSGRNCLVIAP